MSHSFDRQVLDPSIQIFLCDSCLSKKIFYASYSLFWSILVFLGSLWWVSLEYWLLVLFVPWLCQKYQFAPFQLMQLLWSICLPLLAFCSLAKLKISISIDASFMFSSILSTWSAASIQQKSSTSSAPLLSLFAFVLDMLCQQINRFPPLKYTTFFTVCQTKNNYILFFQVTNFFWANMAIYL